MNDIKPRIAVVGAGRMGKDIAQVFAYAGYKVTLIDSRDRVGYETERVLKEASEHIAGNFHFLCSAGVLSNAAIEQIVRRIEYKGFYTMDQVLPECGVIFEAVPEVVHLKQQIFSHISSASSCCALIASTTSTFLVDTLAANVRHPHRFMNTHWLNPAYLIPLVEVSPCQETSPAALRRMMDLLESAGKVPVKCKASPGFIVPRIQALAMNEAARLAEEGVASPEDIDKATRVGFGLRFAVLGLLEFIDWGGGDVLYYASNYLKDSLQADRFSPPEVVSENMDKGRIGMKTGSGFYDFRDRNVTAYQQETIAKFVDLLRHLGLLPSPHLDNGN